MKNWQKIIIMAFFIIGLVTASACVNSSGSNTAQSSSVTKQSPTPTSIIYQNSEYRQARTAAFNSLASTIDDIMIDIKYKKMEAVKDDASNLEIQAKKHYDILNSLKVSEDYNQLKDYDLKHLYNAQKHGEILKLAVETSLNGNDSEGVKIFENGDKYFTDSMYYLDKSNKERDRLIGLGLYS
jgi:hypothetical protein